MQYVQKAFIFLKKSAKARYVLIWFVNSLISTKRFYKSQIDFLIELIISECGEHTLLLNILLGFMALDVLMFLLGGAVSGSRLLSAIPLFDLVQGI